MTEIIIANNISTSNNKNLSVYDYALKYANLGFKILPVAHPVFNENLKVVGCSCGDKCPQTIWGKHPINRGWRQTATNDVKTLEEWFKNNTNNIGIVAGVESNIVVLDIDNKNGVNGLENLKSVMDIKGLEGTFTEQTGNGTHYFFKYPTNGWRIDDKIMFLQGVDIRSDGFMVVAAPSIHQSGKKYVNSNDIFNNPVVIKDFPADLLERLKAAKLCYNDNAEEVKKERIAKQEFKRELGEVNDKCYPPCVNSIISDIKDHKNPTHSSRVFLASFLNEINMPKEDMIKVFEGAYDFNDAYTSYQLDTIISGKYVPKTCENCKKDKICNITGNMLCDCIVHPLEYYRLMKRKGTQVATPQPESVDVDNSNETEPFNYPFKGDFISDWMDFYSTQTDAYIDIHHATAITVLSTIVERKAVMKLKQGDIFPNIWAFVVAQSTISRKSCAIGFLNDYESILMRNGRDKLSKQFNNERLYQELSDHPHAYYINDECGDLLKNLERKQYMSDLMDGLCTLYENASFSRKLSARNTNQKNEYNIINPYVPTLFATVPMNVQRYTNIDYFTSGWLVRFIYYYPKYNKKFMSLTHEVQDDVKKKNEITKRIDEIEVFFSSLTSPISFEMSEDANQYFNEWNEKTDMMISMLDDDVVQSGIGRMEIYALKLAMLYEVAQPNFIDKYRKYNEDTSGLAYKRTNRYPISLKIIKECCREIDEYFLPMFKRVAGLTELGDDKNLQSKIISLLRRRKGKMTRTEIARSTHAKSKDLSEALLALEMESEEIKCTQEGTATKKITYITLIK